MCSLISKATLVNSQEPLGCILIIILTDWLTQWTIGPWAIEFHYTAWSAFLVDNNVTRFSVIFETSVRTHERNEVSVVTLKYSWRLGDALQYNFLSRCSGEMPCFKRMSNIYPLLWRTALSCKDLFTVDWSCSFESFSASVVDHLYFLPWLNHFGIIPLLGMWYFLWNMWLVLSSMKN